MLNGRIKALTVCAYSYMLETGMEALEKGSWYTCRMKLAYIFKPSFFAKLLWVEKMEKGGKNEDKQYVRWVDNT